jgi:short-subunit dehydrogenase
MKKVILVTGASSGMGKKTAAQLIDEGHKVYVVARRIEKMQDLIEQGAVGLKMDITKEEDIQAVVDKIAAEEGRLDVLVNNAGYAIYGSVEETSIDDARRQFEVNIFGLAALTQKFIPMMRAQGSGRIINISSVGGKIFSPLGAWYHATKHALEGWSDCLRLELAQFGIDVVIVQPGGVRTEFMDVMRGPLLERSGNGPYANLANALLNSEKELNAKMPDGNVIAQVISKAIAAVKPKTRYAKGYMARPLLFLRRWLSDRGFQKMLMSQIK